MNLKLGNILMEIDGMIFYNMEGLQKIFLDYKYYSLEDSNVGCENFFVFFNLDIVDNVVNFRMKMLEVFIYYFLNYQSNISEYKESVCINNWLGNKKYFEIINMFEVLDIVDRIMKGDKFVEMQDKIDESKIINVK